MQISSVFCREQQASQKQLAVESLLGNVRAIATSAAAAWGVEAISAERREARHTKRMADAAALAATANDRSVSENPDRGFPDAL